MERLTMRGVEFLLENYRMESVDYLKFDEHND